MSDIELKPCPFCGEKAKFIREHVAGLYGVQCTKCKCMTAFQFDFGEGEEFSKKKASEAWNRRTNDGQEQTTDR